MTPKTTRPPTSEEIAELVAFLPRLETEGTPPIKRWHGGAAEGASVFPWPEYQAVVSAFFAAVSKECWLDYAYDGNRAAALLADAEAVRNATLDEIKTMLTYCLRGERFCDGHWGALIENGAIRRLLQRLQVLQGADG